MKAENRKQKAESRFFTNQPFFVLSQYKSKIIKIKSGVAL